MVFMDMMRLMNRQSCQYNNCPAQVSVWNPEQSRHQQFPAILPPNVRIYNTFNGSYSNCPTYCNAKYCH
jgi:hypothetical protein